MIEKKKLFFWDSEKMWVFSVLIHRGRGVLASFEIGTRATLVFTSFGTIFFCGSRPLFLIRRFLYIRETLVIVKNWLISPRSLTCDLSRCGRDYLNIPNLHICGHAVEVQHTLWWIHLRIELKDPAWQLFVQGTSFAKWIGRSGFQARLTTKKKPLKVGTEPRLLR